MAIKKSEIAETPIKQIEDGAPAESAAKRPVKRIPKDIKVYTDYSEHFNSFYDIFVGM